MFVSIIICTYRRADALEDLLECLIVQTHRDSEILIVDGSGEDASVRNRVESFVSRVGDCVNLRIIQSRKGLTRQRNVGLREARGEVICFFDDDVTFDKDFIAQTIELFQQSGMKDVGGVTGYDVIGYGSPVRLKHKVRRALGFYPSLRPGVLGKCGLVVPVGIQPAFSGCLDVSWLGGFCMLYRREAIAGMWFDEGLPTFGAEDANFSMRVGKRWRLVLCGDLHLKHHRTMTSRVEGAAQIYESSYGVARNQLSESMTLTSIMWLLWYALVELMLDLLSFASAPSWMRLRVVGARQRGLVDGARSISVKRQGAAPEGNLVDPKENAWP
ncbi:MAG: glycosyltransferase family 2 protein [Pyrinomonadaceae bacterium]|nr:glycosyltransferase family 2 protein [Pyrinomonadaceae bacterium]